MSDVPDALRQTDFTVTHAELSEVWESPDFKASPRGFILKWATAAAGFGEATFYVHADGRTHCDNECMSRTFIAAVLAKFLEGVVLDDDKPQ